MNIDEYLSTTSLYHGAANSDGVRVKTQGDRIQGEGGASRDIDNESSKIR